jgi:glycosyltransferase involved in cell wall biosynthesis
MNIAFVTSHLTKSLQWLWFAEALKNRDINQVHIIINETKPVLIDELKEAGIIAYYLVHKNVWSHFINLFKTISIYRRHKINVVHTSLPYGNLIGLLSAFILRIKARLTTCENVSWAHDFKHNKQLIVDKLTFFLSKKIIVTTDSAEEYMCLHWNYTKPKLEIIYHSVKIEAYENVSKERQDSLRDRFQISKDDFTVGMVARLEFWKGHQYAVEAIDIIRKEIPNIRLKIFGSGGSGEEALKTQLEKSPSLKTCVELCGFVEDPIALYKLFDVHLHIPINKYIETGGITILEGMASQCTQVLTLSGYSNQTAIHRENALVVDYENSNEIAEALKELYFNENLRMSLAINAGKKVRAEFSNTLKVEKHLSLYKKLNERYN